MKKGMAKAVEAAVAEVKKQAKTVDGSKDIARVGAVSSGDEEIGKLIADAMEKVSADASSPSRSPRPPTPIRGRGGHAV